MSLESDPSEQRDAPPRQRAQAAAGVLALVLLTFAAFGPALEAGFIWDDDANIENNLPLRTLDGLRALWLEPGATTQYYPLLYTSYWLEYRLVALAPFLYHLDNLLLQAIAAVMLWRILVLLSVPGAWLAAAVFAVHPVQVETVAWVTERKNLLSGVFYLGSGWVYLRYATDAAVGHPVARPRLGYAAAFALYVCALLSKTATVTLPGALAVVLWWKRGRLLRGDWLRLAPMLAMAAPMGALTLSMEKYLGVHLGLDWNPSLAERCLVATRALWFYAGKLAWPTDLTFIYPRFQIDAGDPWQYGYGLALVAVAGSLWLLRDRIGRGPLAGLLFFCGTLVPVLGFFEIYFFRFSWVADHWQYLACIGLIAVACAGAVTALKRVPKPMRPLGPVAAAALLLALVTVSRAQSAVYVDSETLFRDSLSKNWESDMVHYNLARGLHLRGQLEEALVHYRETLARSPEDGKTLNNMGLLAERRNNPSQALRLYTLALGGEPDLVIAHMNRAILLARMGRVAESTGHFRRILELEPTNASARRNLRKLTEGSSVP